MDLKKIIGNFKETRKTMIEGELYYKGKNVNILERKKQFYNIASGRMQDDFTKANNTLPSGFTKMIVDQKVNYSINKDMTIDSEGLDNLININKFRRSLGKVAKQASNKIYGVLHWYISDKELKFKIFPSEQVIVIPNPDDNEEIIKVIRPFKEGAIEYADVYTDSKIEHYEYKNDKYEITSTEANLSLKGTNTEDVAKGWGKVPFSILYNNEEMQNDLARFKFDVDCYDIVKSDLCNNLEDFNEAYWILKGYNGQDAEEFIAEFKRSRIMKIGEDGDASQQSQETPYQARETTLKILKKDIYRFAQAVDPDDIEGDVTNVAIKSMYSQLDLKANEFEMEVQNFADDSMYFINTYAKLMGKTPVRSIELKFDRSMIINEDRKVELANESVGSLSDQTRWEHDPRVQDPVIEQERVNAELSIKLE